MLRQLSAPRAKLPAIRESAATDAYPRFGPDSAFRQKMRNWLARCSSSRYVRRWSACSTARHWAVRAACASPTRACTVHSGTRVSFGSTPYCCSRRGQTWAGEKVSARIATIASSMSGSVRPCVPWCWHQIDRCCRRNVRKGLRERSSSSRSRSNLRCRFRDQADSDPSSFESCRRRDQREITATKDSAGVAAH